MSKAFNEGTSDYALTFGAWSTIVASRLRDIGGRFEPAQKALFGRRAKIRDDDNCMLNPGNSRLQQVEKYGVR